MAEVEAAGAPVVPSQHEAKLAESQRPDTEDGDAAAQEKRNTTTSDKEDSKKEILNGTPNPLSKSQQKKLKRKQEWEDGREARKVKRKIKTKERKERRRATLAEQYNGQDQDEALPATRNEEKKNEAKRNHRSLLVPVTFIYDCNFDSLMTDNERSSLGSQLTRAYSDNKKASFRAHMSIASFGGLLQERFEGILSRHHEHWKGVKFLSEDFVEAAEQAKGWMSGPDGGRPAGALVQTDENGQGHAGQTTTSRSSNEASDDAPTAEAELEFGEDGEVVYLTSDSPNTLTRLRPFGTYIIGGLVDKNRHKGICYKRACERNVKTAKLPIGEFLQMSSRQVLATNHVGEIMLKWLEYGDWGKAFMECIPKRKGGTLKDGEGNGKTQTMATEGGGDENDDEHDESQEADDGKSNEQ